ncbi:hypothetical protein CfE428DRAFT_5838 [Chthoniobacter flavus Ellin428]|uniref:Uncharacterized protein n=1 Tax=Chthoniobacter flavus Ellin428 TaxID=497964 RepID=B4DA98_9BACT|nr:hypothetical protein [Chthoniobacter flavus]EDY16725.1 hypothetical protein CfE428DRAFT_5838 [Chthoniobacter flavus Ellin428]TCO87290.1 hypothetical protein EV701_123127 [Chthoniobacter flavus]
MKQRQNRSGLPKQKMPEEMVNELLAGLKASFYTGLQDGEKRFWWERSLLLRAITHPAREMEPRGMALPWEEYQGMLRKIIGTIKVHGDVGAIRSPGRYLLHAVQEHWRLHWEEYYERVKTLRAATEKEMAKLGARDSRVQDRTVEDLARLHKVVSAGGGRKKGQAGRGDQAKQGELF